MNQMKEGSKISANNFDNRGTIQSKYSLDITQHGSVTRWGDIKSEGNIDYSIDGVDELNLNNELINPIAKGRSLLDIASDISISDNFEIASDLEIRTRNLYINGKLKAKNLKFTLENFALTGYVGTSGDIDVYCYNFTNNSGICEALGNATFNVTNKFTNTSRKRTEQHTIEFSYYT